MGTPQARAVLKELRRDRQKHYAGPRLCLMGQHRAKVTMSHICDSFVGYSCASDDLPHTIHYHGGVGLSSASHLSVSYQAVAFCAERIRNAESYAARRAAHSPFRRV